MADLTKSIRMVVDTGKVKFGSRDAVKSALNGTAKLIVVADNIENNIKSDLAHHAKVSKVVLYQFSGTSIELGSICGKPYPVSALSIFDAGNSNILELAKKSD
ncbi:50S ribosomal protein L30e [Candidatus Micrarchaeota archaeon]|nr:50S ribosomal protein L30e [Candidatus Micrarchaeota archaeon]